MDLQTLILAGADWCELPPHSYAPASGISFGRGDGDGSGTRGDIEACQENGAGYGLGCGLSSGLGLRDDKTAVVVSGMGAGDCAGCSQQEEYYQTHAKRRKTYRWTFKP